MFHRLITGSIALVAIAILSGCASLATPPSAPPAASITRVYHEAIEMSGRLSVRYWQNGEQSLNGGFNWRQQPQRTTVSLLSPLGQTVARIDVAPGVARLQQVGQPERLAPDVDALVNESLGWPLPIRGLTDWLQGFINTGEGARRAVPGLDETRLTTSEGWRLTYVSWVTDAPDRQGDAPRPRRIDLQRNTAQAGLVELRIVIDGWQPVRTAAGL